MKTIGEKLSFIKNKDLQSLPNKPDLIFHHFNLPVVKIDGVTTSGMARSKIFEYNGEKFKRIELIAKLYYEKLGYEASWSEGAGLLLANIGIMSAIAEIILGCFSISDERIKEDSFEEKTKFRQSRLMTYEEKYTEYKNTLQAGGYESYKILSFRIRTMLANGENDPRWDSDHIDPWLIQTKTSEEIKKEMSLAASKLNSENSMHVFEKAMQRFIEENNRIYEKIPHRTARFNQWSLQFAKRIIEIIGVENLYQMNIKNKGIISTSFDLTLIDLKNKLLKFVEVKNSDDFTEGQLLELDARLNKGDTPIELCIIHT